MPRPNSNVVHPQMLDMVTTMLDDTRPDAAQLRAPARVNGASGQTTTWADIGDPVDVRISPVSRLRGQERVIADQVQGANLMVITGPKDWPVEPDQRIVVNGTRTFEVGEVLGPHSYEPELRVVVTEVGL